LGRDDYDDAGVVYGDGGSATVVKNGLVILSEFLTKSQRF